MTPLERLYDYAEHGNIHVCLTSVGFAPAVTIKDGEYYDIALDHQVVGSEAREQELLGHELAHVAVGAFYRVGHEVNHMRRMELRAQRWLAKLLIPPDALMQAVKAGQTEAWELAEHFAVSEDTVRMALECYQDVLSCSAEEEIINSEP